MDSGIEDSILEEILAALQDGRTLEPQSLEASFPGHGATIERMLAAAGRYERLARRGDGLQRGEGLHCGDRLGGFEIVEFIGSGGMGEVYRARQLSLGDREVALKVLPIGLQSEQNRIRFQREGVLLANLHHPRLAEVYGVGEERGLLFFAMRLVRGDTLREVHERMRAGNGAPPGPDLRRRIVGWIEDVAGALARVHEEGLVHRDVKPSNVIVEREENDAEGLPQGHAVLVDFGLVRSFEHDTVTRTAGSPATLDFAPPEQVLGAEVTPRADVFALGVTLHDLLTGRLPCERPRATLGLEPLEELLEGVDADLSAVVGRACDPEPRWRYADAGELHADLNAWLEGRPVSARRRPLVERLRRAVSENPARMARAAVVVGVLAASVLATMGTSRVVRAFGRLHDAAQRRDLTGIAEASRGIPAPFRLLLDRGQRRLAQRLLRADPDDPFSQMHQLVSAGDLAVALLAAATHLRVHGQDSDPMIRWYFEGVLRESLEGEAYGPADRSTALRLAARVCYERPCESRTELEASAELRELVHAAWVDESLPILDRLFGLSALGGCGTGEDLVEILAWTSAPGRTPEETRLGVVASNWIVWRMRGAGDLADIDFAAACEAFAPFLRTILELEDTAKQFRDSSPVDLVVFATRKLLVTLVFAERAQSGGPSRLVSVVPESWLRDLRDRTPDGFWTLWLLAVLGDPRAAPYLLDGPWDVADEPSGFAYWGAFTANLDDAVITSRVRDRCRELAARRSSEPVLVERFESAYERGQLLKHAGGLPAMERLDSDTLLGSEALPGVQLERSVEHPSGMASDLTTFAWSFRTDPPILSPACSDISTQGAAMGSDERGRTYLRFGSFGLSEVDLSFDVEREGLQAKSRPVLGLDHLAALRGLYPLHGRAFLEVSVNGFVLYDKMVVSLSYRESEPRPQEIEIPLDVLHVGTNSLRLRLHEDTTTTYRLFGVELNLDP